MTTPVFSVIHPTLARPDLAIRKCQEWYQKATAPKSVEYVFGVHSFDESTNITRLQDFASTFDQNIRISLTPKRGSASNWDQAATASSGLLLIQAQDDLTPPENWDSVLLERLEKHSGSDWSQHPVFLCVNDGYRTDSLCITSIMTKVYRDNRGFFLCPEYDGVYADDDSTAQAYSDASAGNLTLIEARDIIFKHEHFSHADGLAFDETYAFENRPEAYQSGEALFAKRHPFWHFAQLCKRPPEFHSGKRA